MADMFSLIALFRDAADHGFFPARRNPAIGLRRVNFVNRPAIPVRNHLQQKDTEVRKMTAQNRIVRGAE
ncbi:hypothetical protein HRR99_04970 [Agrobacterium vaccinii]|uniref:hypothetical protein n=1 Tax=Agrobacterium vaccinii TaxID=2735528 RepID=UPI001E42CDB2|nr:hypothetical protein [Agrobacterium vaccinii]UHS60913.1 hypothetical protein HRR99_04970 [Agrobacterium vaccinii]